MPVEELEEILSDETRIQNQPWGSLKKWAMKPNYQQLTWFVSKIANS